jgi:thiosulfate reductase cytochrome b subunit
MQRALLEEPRSSLPILPWNGDKGMDQRRERNRPADPLPVRIIHWIGAAAVICMILGGWAIYNASPSLPFTFPRWMTLGGWLAGGIARHVSAMWALFADGIAYRACGVLSGHFRHDIRSVGPKAVFRDLGAAIRLRLDHHFCHYNAVQRLLYTGVIFLICLAVSTGLSIWKPVQLGWLTNSLAG